MKTITLTRKQIEQLAVVLALKDSIRSVSIHEGSKSGIGYNHEAVYHDERMERDFRADITDVSNW